MKLFVEKKYLALPVNRNKVQKKLLFLREGAPVYELDIHLDAAEPEFTCFADLTPWLGEELELVVEPEMTFPTRWADRIDREDLYREPFRPRVHFTEANGWHNDPNGLVRDAKGRWHMFYQLNPAAPVWNNMHWGHAVSPDLIHWQVLPLAMRPDALGTMFSGSGLRDTENVAGFGKDALLFWYTAAPCGRVMSPFTESCQCLAVSRDDGETLEKYEGNPVLPNIIGENRDPKVIYCEELSAFVMALYLEGHGYALFTSRDLIRWELLRHLLLPGDAECPDFYPLTADDGTRKWIFSGASGKYLVGDMTTGNFVPSQGVRSMHTGSLGYAAQTFSAPEDGRRINVPWDRVTFPAPAPFASQMGIPVEHTLRRVGGEYALYAEPVREFDSLRTQKVSLHSIGSELTGTVAGPAFDAVLCAPGHTGPCELSLLGHTLVLNTETGLLTVGSNTLPVSEESGCFRVRIIGDTASLEVYGGAMYACFASVADTNLNRVTLAADPACTLSVWELRDAVPEYRV